jgi:hypothetical protein
MQGFKAACIALVGSDLYQSHPHALHLDLHDINKVDEDFDCEND